MNSLLDELAWRGLIYDTTPGLAERLAKGPLAGYVGFDPSSPSLQIGNLVPVMLLAHLQRAGGRPIILVGGGTGMIGDPSGKRSERPLLSTEEVNTNAERQRRQLESFLDFSDPQTAARVVNNADWLRDLVLVEFLRDIGKHFTISLMLQKESVKSRMDAGISYTEFSYMLLQAYDFLHLYRTNGCELQMGGSDQWGNITAGVDLIRRIEGGNAHGLSAPLVTAASGAKFGKTEAGAVWLDAERTSPYQFYQFWINVDDRDVEAYLRLFTFKAQDEIRDLMEAHGREPGARVPQRALAKDTTARVHGDEASERVIEASRVRFGELDPKKAKPEIWKMLRTELPSTELPKGFGASTPAIDLVASSGIVKSKGEARRLIEQGGIWINGNRVTDAGSTGFQPLRGDDYDHYWIQRGKKTDSILFTPST
jgi:tyrosyl-tRNA synthetase